MITVKKPGLLTTVQDLGRYGFQKYGVITSGAMDSLAHRLANLLVGNLESVPTLEITMLGPSLQFQADSLVAICGGDLTPELDGKPIQMWRPIFVNKGSILQFGLAKHGCRAYLAVAGGFDVPAIMGSGSTYMRAELGGFKGRALAKDDQIPFRAPSETSKRMFQYIAKRKDVNWAISSIIQPAYQKEPCIRVMKGRHYDKFSKDSQANFWASPFEITPQSDRMGYRLKGPALLLEKDEEMISEAVHFGTIQVPADGNLIILLADSQTVGGYPKIAQIASIDFSIIAQTKPGSIIRFIEIPHIEAQQLLLMREKFIQELKHGIAQKFL